jgi:hypothetical protein
MFISRSNFLLGFSRRRWENARQREDPTSGRKPISKQNSDSKFDLYQKREKFRKSARLRTIAFSGQHFIAQTRQVMLGGPSSIFG